MIDHQRLHDALTPIRARSRASRKKPQKVADYANDPEDHPIAFYLAELFHPDVFVYEEEIFVRFQDFRTPPGRLFS